MRVERGMGRRQRGPERASVLMQTGASRADWVEPATLGLSSSRCQLVRANPASTRPRQEACQRFGFSLPAPLRLTELSIHDLLKQP